MLFDVKAFVVGSRMKPKKLKEMYATKKGQRTNGNSKNAKKTKCQIRTRATEIKDELKNFRPLILLEVRYFRFNQHMFIYRVFLKGLYLF